MNYYTLTPLAYGLLIGIMSSFGDVGIMLSLVMFLVCGYRIWWVGRKRIKIIYENFEEYDKYEDFDRMVAKIWIWDVEKFKK